jgi:formylglycine-generating enzyme required for sulfatase activity
MSDPLGDIRKLEELKASGVLSAEAANAGIAALRAKLPATIQASDSSIAAGRDIRDSLVNTGTVIVTGDGARIVIGEQPAVEMSEELRQTALGRYLEHIVAHNCYLPLQGIRSGGKLVNIELEQIYIHLRTTQQRSLRAEQDWLEAEAALAPGEAHRRPPIERPSGETTIVTIEQALAAHPKLVVLGDPGSGKTTLLRFLALLYGRDLAQGTQTVVQQLNLPESGFLPVLLPLRQIGQFLTARPDDGTQGCALLVEFLLKALKNQRIELPADFFDAYLTQGRAVVLLDGMDEVADPHLRGRVARLVEAFTLLYSKCRFVVTSRIVGYSGAARLQGDYVTTTVRDFSLQDVRQFLQHWHRLVAIGQMGAGASAEAEAARQTTELLESIQANERVRELAINPLLLTVIALVHRDRVKLPNRRAELYAEAVAVLLGKWDEARGVAEIAILDDQPFDAGDRRLLLQQVALHMHERQKKELDGADLRDLLKTFFLSKTLAEAAALRAVERFLRVVEERTGLLTARGEGIYAFSHLTFQEYLAALAIADRDSYVEDALAHSGEPWWREVILLTAGSLSPERATKLIRALANKKSGPVSYQNLMLAVECLRDVGGKRVEGDLEIEIQNRLRHILTIPLKSPSRIEQRLTGAGKLDWVEQRAAAIQALRTGAGYWSVPYGEPEWITIPAGEFWMGGTGKYDEKTLHRVNLPAYQIARVPITNYQYSLFVKATNYPAPEGWENGRPPKGHESHPVVYVAFKDALAYCAWLSQVTGKTITLPSEAEWEKAARGSQDQRAYPWGEKFTATRCNTSELGLGSTTPVGVFLEGASPYGVMDMIGNVWEWTRSLYDYSYPYDPNDRQRENLQAPDDQYRVLRGGSFYDLSDLARCAVRFRPNPNGVFDDGSFRAVCSPFFSR